MKTTGAISKISIDYKSRKPEVTIEIDSSAEELEQLRDKKLSVELKQYRVKRSLNANAYFHVLSGKLADVLHTSKPYMKNILLQKYGQLAIENDSVVSLVIRDDIDMMEHEELHVRPTSKVRVMDDGKLYRVYLLLRGSHTYDTAEMSRLIDGTIEDAKEQGIETATPNELARMKEQWRVES